jgi:nitrile hydratase
MNGIHDMGGLHGFGLIDRDEHPTADWEPRVFALMEHTLASGLYNLDAFRYGIEQMAPADYLQASYYERWLATVEYNLVQSGVLAERELDSRLASVQSPPGGYFQAIGAGPPPIDHIHVPDSATDAPRFAKGDPVMTRTINPAGHTRLPRYARGKRGMINRIYSADPLPDTNAHGLGKHRQSVYSVRFDARELWGQDAEPNQTVSIDLWECYLEPFGSEE